MWKLTFAKRSEEEIYNLHDDPYCVNNLIDNADYKAIATKLRKEMENELKKEADPRMFGEGDILQNYESSNIRYNNAYNRIVVKKEKLIPTWINPSDIETDFIE